jgi:hypothetical protein
MFLVTECAEKRRPAATPSLYIRVGRKYAPAPEDVLVERVRKWAVEIFRPGALVLDRPEFIDHFIVSKTVTSFVKRGLLLA